MKLYHAAPVIVETPDIFHSRDFLDFGKGFYLTPLYTQAEKYALRFVRRQGRAFINEYLLDEDLSGYRRKTFETYDEEWLEFVGACRKGKSRELYDIVSGGIADDQVFNTIDLYFAGRMSKDDALQRLSFEHPNHQICILNQEILLSHLHFIKAQEVHL